MNILFATSEAHPLIKTGGLADVSGYLPRSLRGHGATVHVALPAYSEVLSKLKQTKTVGKYRTDGHEVTLLESRLPGSQVKLWLVACPELFEREGGPYQNNEFQDWPDNALRFAVFARTVVAIAMGWTNLKWKTDIVHCHDWQTGLIPALLKLQPTAPPSVFTIHNLAYQGLFPYDAFQQLELPPHLWSSHALEFYNQLSFVKGGIVFADRVNTVSPRYAEEIKTPEFGCGLDGLLQHRGKKLSGILNGIDTRDWNPGTDPHLAAPYNRRSLGPKSENKTALQKLMGLPVDADTPVLATVTRLTQQKGVDLIIEAIKALTKEKVQFAIVGTGDRALEKQLEALAKKFPDSVGVKIAYSEPWAHLAIAGADGFLMPSRFEPCGLTQLYSLRYGTLPIVHNVGGLADTVTDASDSNLKSKSATGFVFNEDSGAALATSIRQALKLYKDKRSWKAMQQTAMKHDYSWNSAAESYIELYQSVLAD